MNIYLISKTIQKIGLAFKRGLTLYLSFMNRFLFSYFKDKEMQNIE